MAKSIRTHLRKARMQRWLRQEALLLAQEADSFDCPYMRQEAGRLLDLTGSIGNLWVLRTA